MASKTLLGAVKEAILRHTRKQQGAGFDPAPLLRQVETLFEQYGADALDAAAAHRGQPDSAMGGELDDYDAEHLDDDGEMAEDLLIDGTLTELGAKTPSPFGGTIPEAEAYRYGSPRPASQGPYGGPGEQTGFHNAADEVVPGDRTTPADRRFANRAAARRKPGEDREDVGET